MGEDGEEGLELAVRGLREIGEGADSGEESRQNVGGGRGGEDEARGLREGEDIREGGHHGGRRQGATAPRPPCLHD